MQKAIAAAASNMVRNPKVIRFARYGCANRPFFHIVVTDKRKNQHMPITEQVGTFDPMPNIHNEKLVSFNFERVRYWIGKGAVISQPVSELLGLAGFLPIHPHTYMTAWRNRAAAVAAEKAAESSAKQPASDGQPT